MDSLKKAFRNEKAQGMVEYILLVLVIALVAVVAFRTLGNEVSDKANEATDELTSSVVYMVR